MYGLPQSGILANKLLEKRLENQGYHELPHTPGLLRHETRQIWFTLVVDNFGIKYVGEENAKRLLGVLKEFYEMEEDWNGGLYCGITLEWHYKEQYLDIPINYRAHIYSSRIIQEAFQNLLYILLVGVS